MILVSLVNSGESFEKCVALVDCAYKANADYYKSFEKVYVFYSDNLQKHHDQKVSGSLKAFIDFCDEYCVGIKLKSKQETLGSLLNLKIISKKTFIRCIKNTREYNKIISNVPWYIIYNVEKDKILQYMNMKYPNVEFVHLNTNISFDELYDGLPLYQRVAKIYFMDRGGCIASKDIGKMDINISKIRKCFNKSVIQAYNVFLFINTICAYAKMNLNDFKIGYRPASRYVRKTYETAIKIVNENYPFTIEPSNLEYNKNFLLFNAQCVEDKNFSVIYKAFYNVLKEIP